MQIRNRKPEEMPGAALAIIIGVIIGSFLMNKCDAHAQTLTTAETLGKGKSSVLVASNAIIVKDFTTLSYSFAQGVYGVGNKVDAYGGVGITTAFGQAQASLTGGANINLLKSKKVSMSTFNLLTIPLNRRVDAATVTWFTAVVASRDLHLKKLGLVGYTGYSVTVPVGHNLADKLFTPPSPVYNIPIGVLIPKGKFGLFVEGDYGRQVKTVSVGLAYNP